MTTQDEQSLKNEIQHIFDSGANEMRILEMVKSFIEKRGQALYTHDVISRFFKEMAEKHNVKVNDLNIHISYNQLYIQEYTPNQRNEFKCLEIVDLNGL